MTLMPVGRFGRSSRSTRGSASLMPWRNFMRRLRLDCSIASWGHMFRRRATIPWCLATRRVFRQNRSGSGFCFSTCASGSTGPLHAVTGYGDNDRSQYQLETRGDNLAVVRWVQGLWHGQQPASGVAGASPRQSCIFAASGNSATSAKSRVGPTHVPGQSRHGCARCRPQAGEGNFPRRAVRDVRAEFRQQLRVGRRTGRRMLVARWGDAATREE